MPGSMLMLVGSGDADERFKPGWYIATVWPEVGRLHGWEKPRRTLARDDIRWSGPFATADEARLEREL